MAHKRQAGDRWGLISIDLVTGEKKSVQIGYWESTTFPYVKTAREYAEGLNKDAIAFNSGRRYESRYIGNWKTGYCEENSDVHYCGGGW